MKENTPLQACIDAGLDTLKEAVDLTGIKNRVLFKWFIERRHVFDMVVADAVFIKTGKVVNKDCPSCVAKVLNAHSIIELSEITKISLVDIYKWSVEKEVFLFMVIAGSARIKEEQEKRDAK